VLSGELERAYNNVHTELFYIIYHSYINRIVIEGEFLAVSRCKLLILSGGYEAPCGRIER
jgi:hypothetical protein